MHFSLYSSSVLHNTIIDLFPLNDAELRSLYQWAELCLLTDIFDFGQNDHYSLQRIGVFETDSLDNLLNMSFAYLLSLNDERLIDIIIYKCIIIIGSKFDKKPDILKMLSRNVPVIEHGLNLFEFKSFPFKTDKLHPCVTGFIKNHPNMTISDLKNITEYQIIHVLGLNYSSLQLLMHIKDIPRLYLPESMKMAAYFETRKKWSSPDTLLSDWTYHASGHNKNYGDIVYLRLFHHSRYTLAMLSQRFKVSKERIRQIVMSVSKKLSRSFNKKRLDPLWELIYHIVERHRIISLENTCRHINNTFGWNKALTPRVLKNLLTISSDLRIDICECKITSYLLLVKNDLKCRTCKPVIGCLKNIINSQKAVKSEELAQTLDSQCKNNCPFSFHGKFTRDFCFYIYLKNKNEFNHITLRDFIFFTRDAYKIYKSSIIESIRHLLTKKRDGHTIKEVYDRLIRYKNREISLNKVRQIIYSEKDYLAWEGGKYISITNLDLDLDLIGKIEKEISIQLLNNNPVSIKEIYEKFSNDCNGSNIPGPRSLYSCLKYRGNPGFCFYKYPLIKTGR